MVTISQRRLAFWALYLVAFLIGAGTTYLILKSNFIAARDQQAAETRSFVVEKGWNLKQVCQALSQQGFVNSWWGTWFVARLKKEKLIENNRLKLRAGEYFISAAMTPSEILDKLARGDIAYRDIVIPEGITLKDIGDLMIKTTLTNPDEVKAALNNRALMVKMQIPASSFEGYLFPDTYKFTKPDNAEFMVATMIETGEKKKTSEMIDRAVALNMTWHQVLTLASIIEKETGNAGDRKTISSVFHNRLRMSMPLQSDPTVIYGIPNFDGNLTKEHLTTPSPYNTYINQGLPPTPICSPGLDSILAALYPADTDYLYFVAKGDGKSHFSTTYKEHQEAVRKYQGKKQQSALEAVLND